MVVGGGHHLTIWTGLGLAVRAKIVAGKSGRQFNGACLPVRFAAGLSSMVHCGAAIGGGQVAECKYVCLLSYSGLRVAPKPAAQCDLRLGVDMRSLSLRDLMGPGVHIHQMGAPKIDLPGWLLVGYMCVCPAPHSIGCQSVCFAVAQLFALCQPTTNKSDATSV